MTPQELICIALGRPKVPKMAKYAKEETCWLCGVYVGNIRKGDVVGTGFTNWDRACRPESGAVCDYCWTCLRSEYARKLRSSNWLATQQGIEFFKRDGIAKMLFDDKQVPFCFYVTTSFKKLGAIKVSVQTDSARFIVQFEELPVMFSCEHVELFETMQLLYSIPKEEEEKKQPKSFFTKAEIQTGDFQFHRMREFGIDEWRIKNEILGKWRGSGVFGLLLYAVSQEKFGRNKVKGITNGSKSKRKPIQASCGKRHNLSGLACDRQGQYVFFPLDEDI